MCRCCNDDDDDELMILAAACACAARLYVWPLLSVASESPTTRAASPEFESETGF